MRTLAFAGMLAFSGCATTQTAPTARPSQPARGIAPAQSQETPAQRCQRERRSRVQECIIEGISASCRESSGGDEERLYSCLSEGLAQPNDVGAARQVTVTVSQGDDVLSMRSGEFVIMDVVRLEAAAIDRAGVGFNYSIERLATAAPEQRARVELASVRMNFDGTRSGDWFRLEVLSLWNLRVEAASSGQARVSFETNDPRILPGQGDSGAAAPEKKK